MFVLDVLQAQGLHTSVERCIVPSMDCDDFQSKHNRITSGAKKVRKKFIEWNMGFMIKQVAAHDINTAELWRHPCLRMTLTSQTRSVHELCTKCANT